MNFPRQPKLVKLIFEGEREDVEHYMRKIKHLIEAGSYDHVTFSGAIALTIHPAAVND